MKKLISKLMSLALMTTMALNLAVSAGWATITESGHTSYTYSANGVLQTAANYTVMNGADQLSQTTYYDAMGRASYIKDANGQVTAHYNYNPLTGNHESTDFIGTGPDGATHVYTQYNVAPGVSVTVDHGSGATLSETGTSGGENNYTYSQVKNAYEAIIQSGSTATWKSQNINISSIQLSGSVIKGLSTSQLARVLGYEGFGATGQMTESDLQSIISQATANPTSNFSFAMDANVCATTYSYFDKASGETKNMTITTVKPATSSSGDPLVTGSISNIRVITDNNGVEHYYIEVAANKVDMFDGNGQKDADGATIMIEVDEATAATIKDQIGQEITISGNVTAKVDGHLTMTMNEGGYQTGEDSHQKWMESHKSFYNSMVSTMIGVYNTLGVGNAAWQAKWEKLEKEGQIQLNF